MNSIFNSDRTLSREVYNSYENLDISGSAGSIISELQNIDCRGYKTIVVKVTGCTGDVKLFFTKGIVRSFIPIYDYYSISKKSFSYGIRENGLYLIDVSDAITIHGYRESAITSATVTLDIARLTTGYEEMLPKIVELRTALVTCTDNGNKTPISGLDTSMFRFLTVRLKTVPQEGGTAYEVKSADVSLSFQTPNVLYSDYTGNGTVRALSMTNNYILQSDWIPVNSPTVNVYLKDQTDPVPTSESPNEYEVTIFGIR